jgi:hypothetical protein
MNYYFLINLTSTLNKYTYFFVSSLFFSKNDLELIDFLEFLSLHFHVVNVTFHKISLSKSPFCSLFFSSFNIYQSSFL